MIPIYGVIVPRATMFTKMSGGTALTDFQDALAARSTTPRSTASCSTSTRRAARPTSCRRRRAMIRAARAVEAGLGRSRTRWRPRPAYWLLSQCTRLVVTPSGEVGSIGVFAAHEDISPQLEQDGVKVTLIRAGKFKAETNPFEPLSEEAQAALQERVDEFYGMFVRDVAKGRNVSVDAVRSGFGEGRIVTAKNALDSRDGRRVDTFEATVQRMIRAERRRRRTAR
jgi:hypothetical protein